MNSNYKMFDDFQEILSFLRGYYHKLFVTKRKKMKQKRDK